MSDYDLAKASADALFAPVADLFRAIAGPAAEEFGFAMRDRVRVFRREQQLRLLVKTKQIMESANLPAQRVPLRLLGSILDNAAWEEDESLHDMWAALLANGAAGKYKEIMFPEMLRQLSPADACLLRNCFREVIGSPRNYVAGIYSVRDSIFEWATALHAKKNDKTISRLSLENLSRLGLLALSGLSINGVGGDPRLTKIGFEFMHACEDPTFIRNAEEDMLKDPAVARMKARSGQ